MEDMRISVIIPVYKVEPYLDCCVRSIVNQSYRNLEIILVDDGSPDNCPALCDAWAARDSRIKVLHKDNGGLSDARNAGLDIASGYYIALIDSDDAADTNMLSSLMRVIQETGADIAECDYMKFEADPPSFPSDLSGTSRVFSAEEALAELLQERSFHYTAWNKLYRREIFTDLRYEVGKLHEDVFLTYQAFGKAARVAKLDLQLYGYRQRGGSIMNTAFSLQKLDSLEARERQLAYIRSRYPALAGLAQSQLLGNCRYFGQLALHAPEPWLTALAIERIRPVYRKESKKLQFRPTAKERLWLLLGRISFSGCCRIRNKLGIGL